MPPSAPIRAGSTGWRDEAAELADHILARLGLARMITAIAGAPGAGKATLAEALGAALNQRRAGVAAVAPGRHLAAAGLNAGAGKAGRG